MNPLFVLKTGKWGSSITFEIARKIGFSKEILDQAVAKIGTTQLITKAYAKNRTSTDGMEINCVCNKLLMNN
jgi:dsDNA-specific endonuclease/ATPase MutS2